MGQGLSCSVNDDDGLFTAARHGDLEAVAADLKKIPSLIHRGTVYDRNSLLHIAAANGQIEVLCWLLNRSINPDSLNRHKQTPLMLAAIHGKSTCVELLIEAGANILKFDTVNERTCLHYAAYYGHYECLKVILAAARNSHVAVSWGYARFVNIRDGKGATPLHLAARQRQPDCVHTLLENGAIVCASTGGYSYPGSTPLHLAARGGSIDCIRELLAWGADRIQRDASGRIPYTVALRQKFGACAALLNPSSAEPLVWPSPLKFISELNQEAKVLLEHALMEANREREKNILKGTPYILPSPSHSDEGSHDDNASEDSDTDLCGICFDQVCTIEVQKCGHQMCAHCTLALCCHNKPNPMATNAPAPPVCPFCRSSIVQLVVANKIKSEKNMDNWQRKSKKSWNLSEGSSSFKGFSSVGDTIGKMVGLGSSRIVVDTNECIDKPLDQ